MSAMLQQVVEFWALGKFLYAIRKDVFTVLKTLKLEFSLCKVVGSIASWRNEKNSFYEAEQVGRWMNNLYSISAILQHIVEF